ncbi:MAG TPA: trehalose-6-phosphate synthase [Gaiellaceae bacterium]|nr:trehalose-6-phosphate synthase [Gaiellaceae bacterium]
MTDRRRLIVVSNRGPVVHGRDAGGRRVARRGGGGLVTAIDSLASHFEVTWVASAFSDEDRAVAEEAGGGAVDEVSRAGSKFRLRLVPHDPDAFDRYYNVVANPMLWFVQHRLWDLARSPVLDATFEEAWQAGYATVNAGFADAIVAELEDDPGSTVFFHDYHLYLAPRMVRERVPSARLAHFVHIPWVSIDGWSVLPHGLRWAVHSGLLANDLVGFHTERWRRLFAEAAAAVVGAELQGAAIEYAGHTTHTMALPISVDPGELEALATDEAVLEAQAELRRRRPERLVVRVDRTDPSKNILRGFTAFELLLDRHPEHRGRVRMLALLDPSRQGIAEYSDYTAEIESMAADVNERAGAPVIDLRIGDDFPLSVAAYMEYDVLFVNPIFDGLNLVAKEGPLVNERDGALVLSENAGAAEELAPWALVVSPFDVEEQAEALHRALEMPAAERSARLAGIRDHVREHDIAWWADGIMAALDELPATARS